MRRRHWSRDYGPPLLGALLLLLVGLTPASGSIRDLGRAALYPLTAPLGYLADHLGSVGQLVAQVGSLDRSRSRLQSELTSARAELARLHEVQSESESLRRELDLPIRTQYLLVAVLVEASSGTVPGEVAISKGSDQGIKQGMAALLEGSLVGTVVQSGPSTAIVRLLASPGTNIPARVGPSGTPGIVRSSSGKTIVDNVSAGTELSRGGDVVTGGSSGLIPAGLLIGRVATVTSSPSQIFQRVSLQTAAAQTGLSHLFILVGSR